MIQNYKLLAKENIRKNCQEIKNEQCNILVWDLPSAFNTSMKLKDKCIRCDHMKLAEAASWEWWRHS